MSRTQPAVSQKVAPPPKSLIAVMVMINYGDGSVRQAKFRWPTNITEPQGLNEVLKTQSRPELDEICAICFNPAKRANLSIAWMEAEPFGKYKCNQNVYGPGGTKGMGIPAVDDYDPDIPGVVYNGSVAGFTVDAAPLAGQSQRVGPQYDPDDIYAQQQRPFSPRY